MSFRWFLPVDRELEESFLFRFAAEISLLKSGVFRNREAVETYLLPLFESKGVHQDETDNFIAYALLGGILDPVYDPGRRYPQNSQEWLTFRRLFLELCDREIPEGLQLPEASITPNSGPQIEAIGGSAFEGDSSTNTAEPRLHDSALGLPPLLPLEIFDTLRRRELPYVKMVTSARLQSYAVIDLANVRASIIDTGRAELDECCGALYEIVRAIPRRGFPVSTTFLPPVDFVTTESLIAEVIKELGLDFSFEDEYRAAAHSARSVLFDIAVETTLGKLPPQRATAADLEGLYCDRRIIEDPYSILSDVGVQAHFADGIATQGETFLRSIASKIETARDRNTTRGGHSLKLALATYWVHPQYPLWLMSNPARMSFLRLLDLAASEDAIREFTKARCESPLRKATKNLITECEITLNPPAYKNMRFPDYLQRAPSFEILCDHVQALSVEENVTEF